jgi:hypothetical protein
LPITLCLSDLKEKTGRISPRLRQIVYAPDHADILPFPGAGQARVHRGTSSPNGPSKTEYGDN